MNNTTERLARAFLAQLLMDIGREDYNAVREQTKEKPLKNICYSHDYCDANMTMAAAFDAVGIRFDMDNDEHAQLWGDAWNRALEILVA